MTREEVERVMGTEPKIQASFEVIGDDVKFIKLIVNGKEKVISIEELENTLSEPCDCICREEVCDYIAEFVNHEYATDREREMVKHIIGGIQHLPSIQPKSKTGHWIGHREHCENLGVMPSGLGAYEWCSNCDCGIDLREWHRNNYNFCPNCGARMVDPQESEDKE